MGDSRWLYNRIASARQTENSKKRCFVWSPTAHIEYIPARLFQCTRPFGIQENMVQFNYHNTSNEEQGFFSPEMNEYRKTIEFKKI